MPMRWGVKQAMGATGTYEAKRADSSVDSLWLTRQQSMFDSGGLAKLRQATVLVAGVGGLGGAAATYLTTAGVGRLIILHEGVVEYPDLNRQTLMGWEGVGRKRIELAKKSLLRLNPHLIVDTIDARVTETDLDDWLTAVDFVIDARYTVEERFRLNEICVANHLPMMEVAMSGWEFYLFAVFPQQTPCLRCLFQESENWEGKKFPVLGSVSATAGTIAATQVIKYLSGIEDTPQSTLYWHDSLNMQQLTIQVKRNPHCPVCGGVPL